MGYTGSLIQSSSTSHWCLFLPETHYCRALKMTPECGQSTVPDWLVHVSSSNLEQIDELLQTSQRIGQGNKAGEENTIVLRSTLDSTAAGSWTIAPSLTVP